MNDSERHLAASKKMQSGVAFEHGRDGPESAKHLRVGINVALVDHGSLVALLLRKGIITEAEYLSAIADGMEAEVKRYEAKLTRETGAKVTLGEAGFGR